MDDDLDHALANVGLRLRTLRKQRETTLAYLSTATGISVSTLSRLESGPVLVPRWDAQCVAG